MNIGFVHCWIAKGGALNVLEDLILKEISIIEKLNKTYNIYIFTLFSDRKNLNIQKNGVNIDIKIITALPYILNNIFNFFSKKTVPFFSFFFDYRNLMLFYPFLTKHLSFKLQAFHPQKVIISSFAIAKNIDIPILDGGKLDGGTRVDNYLYLHSPMQYIWSHELEYTNKINGLKGFIFKQIIKKLKAWDSKTRFFDFVFANSKYTSLLAKEIYNFDCIIKYPKINNSFLESGYSNNNLNYYVYVGRLARLVRDTDKIIKLFNSVHETLLVMGTGPDEKYLKSISGKNIIFLGRIDDVQEKINIIKESRGLINIAKESFGINTLEALLLGVPVFGFNDGATPELVDKKSGILVANKNKNEIIQKFKIFNETTFNREYIYKKARKISSKHQFDR